LQNEAVVPRPQNDSVIGRGHDRRLANILDAANWAVGWF
jgi:hypothetical protein